MVLYSMAKEQRPSTGPTARLPVTFHCTAGQMIGFMYTAMAIGDVTVKIDALLRRTWDGQVQSRNLFDASGSNRRLTVLTSNVP